MKAHLGEGGCAQEGETARGDVCRDVVDYKFHLRRAVSVVVASGKREKGVSFIEKERVEE